MKTRSVERVIADGDKYANLVMVTCLTYGGGVAMDAGGGGGDNNIIKRIFIQDYLSVLIKRTVIKRVL